jgi:hypothetical protein
LFAKYSLSSSGPKPANTIGLESSSAITIC